MGDEHSEKHAPPSPAIAQLQQQLRERMEKLAEELRRQPDFAHALRIALTGYGHEEDRCRCGQDARAPVLG